MRRCSSVLAYTDMGHDGVEGERAVAAEHLDEDAGEQKKPHQQQQKKDPANIMLDTVGEH